MLSQINLPQDTIQKEASQIFNAVKYGESGITMCYPACKMQFNIVRFLENKQLIKRILGSYYNKYAFLLIHCVQNDTYSSILNKIRASAHHLNLPIKSDSDLANIVKIMLRSGKDPYLFLFNAESLASCHLKKVIKAIHDEILTTPKFGATLFYEGNIYDSPMKEILKNNNRFLRNVFILSSYQPKVCRWYIQSLTKEWKMSISKDISDLCIKQSGGILWILRELIRLLKMNSHINLHDLINAPSIILRLETLISMFSHKERETLIQIKQNGQSNNIAELTYLLRIGIIQQNGSTYEVTSHLLANALESIPQLHSIILDNKNQIHANGAALSPLCSRQEEAVLKLLINNKKSVVTRDTVAQALWGENNEEKYSDWAIDRVLFRVRKILITQSIPPTIIRTIKKRGYILLCD